jgi:MEMO1 family protein
LRCRRSDATDPEAAEALERVWCGPETCIVVSSDLSHYYPYATAERLDRETARAIEQLSPEDIGEEHACGRIGVRGLLLVARARGLHATTLDLRNSGDTAGTRDKVVGYGAFSFE